MWQSSLLTVVSVVYILCASPIAAGIGVDNWYVLGAGLSAVVLIFSIFFVPETSYSRDHASQTSPGAPLVARDQSTIEILVTGEKFETSNYNMHGQTPGIKARFVAWVEATDPSAAKLMLLVRF